MIRILCFASVIYFVVSFMTGCVSTPKALTHSTVTVEGLGSVKNLSLLYPGADHTNWKDKRRLSARVCHVHSCGWEVVEKGADCEILITYDARTCTLFRSNKNFSKPEGVGIHYAYYQTKPLRGYPIKGAINIKVEGSSHTGLPEFVFEDVKEILK